MKDLGLIAPGNWFARNGKMFPLMGVRKGIGTNVPSVIASEGFERLDSGFTPIPLTPDLLRRLGFEQDGPKFRNGGISLMRHPERYVWFFSVNGNRMTFFAYLHELQNGFELVRGEPLPVTAEMLEGGRNE